MPSHADLGILDAVRELAARLDSASRGERGALIAQTCALLRVSRQQCYRLLAEVGWSSGRKRRSDFGSTSLQPDEVETIGAILMQSTRLNGKRLLGLDDAVDLARHNGLISSRLSASQISRVLHAQGFHPEQAARETPHITQRSLHPNHTWQLDASVCVLYYLDGGGLRALSEREFYKNKPANLRKVLNDRVVRWAVTDHYSGATWFEYRMGAEDTESLFGVLQSAVHKRDDAQDPMHGVPLQLVMDAGSANVSALFRNLLERLQVRQITHAPGNARAKGSVEKAHDLIECGFEGRLAFGRRIDSLDELNAAARIWRNWFNGVKTHTRHGHTRNALWQTIRGEQLRIAPPPDVCRELLVSKPAHAKVSKSLTVRYHFGRGDTHEYSVAHLDWLRVGDTVEVVVNPYAAPDIWLLRAAADGSGLEHHALHPVVRDAAGFRVDAPVIGEQIRSAPDTAADTARKAMLKRAYGVETLRDAEAARKARKPAFPGIDTLGHLQQQTVAHYIGRKGIELPVERPRVESKPLSHVAAAKALRGLGVEMSRERFAWLEREHPVGVRADLIEEIAAQFLGRAATRKVSGA